MDSLRTFQLHQKTKGPLTVLTFQCHSIQILRKLELHANRVSVVARELELHANRVSVVGLVALSAFDKKADLDVLDHPILNLIYYMVYAEGPARPTGGRDACLQLCLVDSNSADVDKNGKLEFGEFVAVSVHLQRMDNDEHLRKAFTFFDKNGSGYIEIDELKEGLADGLGQDDEEVLNDIVREVDTDKDGRISYEEFVAMMKTGTDWRKSSRHYSRERFNNLSVRLMKDGSLQMTSDDKR